MNRNDIVRQYRWLRILRVFLKIFSRVLMFLLFGLAYVITIFGTMYVTAFLYEKLGLDNSFCIFALWLIMCLPLFIFLSKREKFMYKSSRSILNKLSNILFRHYEKKWGMTENEIKDYISRRGRWEISRIGMCCHTSAGCAD